MAQIRTVVPQAAVTNFRQGPTDAGGGFRLLAGALDTAYEYLKPKAIQEMTEAGDALGRDIAKQQIGEPAPPMVAMSTKGEADPNATLGADAMAALGHGGGYRASLIGTESGGNWAAQNNETGAGGKKGHFGRVQFGRARLQDAMNAGAIPQGTTPEQFMASPELQIAAENWHFSDLEANLADLVGREVNGQVLDMGALVAMGHLGGAGGARQYVESGGAYNPSDSFGTSLSDYARTHGGSGGGTSVSLSTADSSVPAAPTVMRTADGKLTSRLFGPTSNPILAAHDAAAGVAYQADVFLKASADMMGLSEQFALDPAGFKSAADEYVKNMVASAPEDFRMDVRAELEKEAGRRYLGIMDERQRDIRQRANNSTAALADKWSDDLAGAIASGNQEEAAVARSQLSAVLATRERLPGLSWTPEQSANYMAKVEAEGQSRIKKAQDEQASAWKSALSTITDAAKAGLHAADETLLDNPAVQALLPDEWRKAAAFTTLRDQLPTFNSMTPAAQAAALAEMKSQPVQEEWEVDLYSAAEDAAAASAKAWKDDPIKRAGEVLTDEPPPPLPAFDQNDPSAFMAALGARAAYGQKLVDAGYIKSEIYLSKEEAKTVGAMFGKDVPPEIKAMAAGAVVGAMGADAEGLFRQINTTDPVIPHVGALMARGGDPAVATEAMTGQALLDQKVVQAPTAGAVTAGMSKVQEALANTPGALQGMEGVKKAAIAIYAARIAAGADEETQKQVMEEAWQSALGQSNSLGRITGGVQEVGAAGVSAQKVLLPPGVNGEELGEALDRAFGFQPAFGIAGWLGTKDRGPQDDAMWMAAAGSVPALGGQPIDQTLWRDGSLVMTPIKREGGSGSEYLLSHRRWDGTSQSYVLDYVRTLGATGDVPFIFDAEKLIAAGLVPR